MTKHQLIQDVRNRYNLHSSNNAWFTKDEMVQIVSQLKGPDFTWSDNNTFFEEELYSIGWQPQATTDSHPTSSNLEFLSTVDYPSDNQSSSSETQVSTITSDLFTSIGFNLTNLKKIQISEDRTQVTFTF